MANTATASPTFACSQQVPPAGAGGERCLPRCPRGPRRMGQPGRLGAGLGHVGHAGGVQLPEGPRVQPCFIFRHAPLALWSTRSSRSLSLVLTSPYRRSFSSPGFLACGTPGGSRAMPSPKLGTLHARSPGPQVIFRPHPTNPLMQSSDAVAGCAAVWPLMGRSSSSFPPVRL